jgi:predicted permease
MSAGAQSGGKLTALLAKDLRGILRDRLLFFLLAYSVVLAAIARAVVPLIPVEGLGLYLAPGVVIVGTLLVGSVLGLLLVDEREARTWLLLRVLPVSDASLGLYLFGLAWGLGLAAAVLCVAVYGHPVLRPGLFAAALAVAALGAPFLTLLLATLASNKIEAMALGKLLNFPVAMPLLAFVVPAPWQPALWWSPWYWIYLALIRSQATAATVEAAPIADPGVPDAVVIAIPTALLLAASLALARRFRIVAS